MSGLRAGMSPRIMITKRLGEIALLTPAQASPTLVNVVLFLYFFFFFFRIRETYGTVSWKNRDGKHNRSEVTLCLGFQRGVLTSPGPHEHCEGRQRGKQIGLTTARAGRACDVVTLFSFDFAGGQTCREGQDILTRTPARW